MERAGVLDARSGRCVRNHQNQTTYAWTTPAVVAYTTFPEEMRGEHVIHWIDNESAVYALVKGYSRAADSARIVTLYHSCVSQLGITPWIEYVQSEDNIADLPSRGEFELLRILGGDRAFRAAVVPSLGTLVGPLMPLLA